MKPNVEIIDSIKTPNKNSKGLKKLSLKKPPTISPVGYFNTFNKVNKFIYETLIWNENYNFNNKNIINLDLSRFPKINKLYCNDNKLTHLDLSKSPHLEVLECNGNQLTHLDLSKSPHLEVLECNENQLTHLDLSNLQKLKYLYCNNNQITELDLSRLPNLETVEYKNNNNIKIILNKNYVLRKYLTDKLYYAINNFMSKKANTQTIVNIPLYNDIPLNSYIDVINKNMIPFKNIKMRNVFSLTNITKKNDGCYKLLKGNYRHEINRVMYYFRFFDVIAYEYEFDDNVLAIDIYKHNNYTLYDSIYKIITGATPYIYETAYLLINPNIEFEYLSQFLEIKFTPRYENKSNLNTEIEGKIFEMCNELNDYNGLNFRNGLYKLNGLTGINFNQIFDFIINVITGKKDGKPFVYDNKIGFAMIPYIKSDINKTFNNIYNKMIEIKIMNGNTYSNIYDIISLNINTIFYELIAESVREINPTLYSILYFVKIQLLKINKYRVYNK
jgi:hypothetical protein